VAISRRSVVVSAGALALLAKSAQANGVTIRRRYVDGPYGQIHVRIARPDDPARETAPPLACFHYSPGSSRMYADILQHLAANRMVMAFDTPGYGNSDAPSEQPYIDDYARALAGAVRQLTDARQIDVLGHLTGSFIAIDLAVLFPGVVRRVVLSRSPVFDQDTRDRGASLFRQIAAQRATDTEGRYLVENLEMSLGTRLPNEPLDRVVGTYVDSLLAGEDWVFGEIAAFSYQADLQMAKITQQTLYLTWTRDYAGAGAAFGGEETWEGGKFIIPNVTVQELTGLGLDAWQKDAAMIADHVLTFLDD
jgi:pimeloyl-ACP methyl ester carboxylesterase